MTLNECDAELSVNGMGATFNVESWTRHIGLEDWSDTTPCEITNGFDDNCRWMGATLDNSGQGILISDILNIPEYTALNVLAVII
jgi:hypothetical protein